MYEYAVCREFGIAIAQTEFTGLRFFTVEPSPLSDGDLFRII